MDVIIQYLCLIQQCAWRQPCPLSPTHSVKQINIRKRAYFLFFAPLIESWQLVEKLVKLANKMANKMAMLNLDNPGSKWADHSCVFGCRKSVIFGGSISSFTFEIDSSIRCDETLWTRRRMWRLASRICSFSCENQHWKSADVIHLFFCALVLQSKLFSRVSLKATRFSYWAN